MLTAMQSLHFFHLQIRKKIVLIDVVPGSPNKPGSRSFRTSFYAEFDFPLNPLHVANGEFGTGTILVFLLKNKGADRLVFFPARAIK